jgi:hypothetical protein
MRPGTEARQHERETAKVKSRLPMAYESWMADGVRDIAADIAEFGQGDVFQPFTASIEAFVDFNGGFLHETVGIIASAPEEEVFSPRNPGLPVVIIEGQAQQGGRFFRFVGCTHGGIL